MGGGAEKYCLREELGWDPVLPSIKNHKGEMLSWKIITIITALTILIHVSDTELGAMLGRAGISAGTMGVAGQCSPPFPHIPASAAPPAETGNPSPNLACFPVIPRDAPSQLCSLHKCSLQQMNLPVPSSPVFWSSKALDKWVPTIGTG